MKKSILLRTSIVILIACILLAFPFVACEHDSNANSNPTNNGSTTGNQSPNPELPEGTYSITFVLDGGSWIEGYTPTPSTYTANDNVNLPVAAKVHKEGYTFKGWYENNSLKFGFAKGTTGNKTYTAHWEDGEHTPVGYYNNGSGDTACLPGKYQDRIDSTNCSPCRAGTYQNNEGATGCFTTPAGSYSTAGASAPTRCAAGQTSSSDRSSCVQCPIGTYNSSAGSPSSIPSPTGTYVSTTGARTPTTCPAGTYQDETGQSSCKACPTGTTSSAGSTSISACQ